MACSNSSIISVAKAASVLPWTAWAANVGLIHSLICWSASPTRSQLLSSSIRATSTSLLGSTYPPTTISGCQSLPVCVSLSHISLRIVLTLLTLGSNLLLGSPKKITKYGLSSPTSLVSASHLNSLRISLATCVTLPFFYVLAMHVNPCCIIVRAHEHYRW